MESTSNTPGSSAILGEFTVKMAKNSGKNYSVMQFNRQHKVDFKQCATVKMERENNLKEFKATAGDDVPLFGAGSEFGRERREEARRKKYGVRTKKYKEEDQPWILKLGGKAGKKFKGRKEGLVAENSCYYILKQLPDSTYEAQPVDSFYNFSPMIQYRTLNAEEAEEEFGRRDRTMNFFNVMLQKKLKDSSQEGEEEDRLKKQKAKSKGLKITEDDEFQNLLLSDDERSEDDDSDSNSKKGKKKGDKGGKGKKKKAKKKKVEEDEAAEESDEGDFDARELDYISEESSDEEAEIEEKHDIKGIDQELQKIEDEEQEDEVEAEKEEDEAGSKEEGEIDKEKKDDDSDSCQSDSSDSDIDDSKIQSAFLMQKKPGKKSSNRSSSRSSTGPSSRSTTPTPSDTTKTLSDAAVKLQKEPDLSGKVKRTESPTSRPAEKSDPVKIKTENGELKFKAIKRPPSSLGDNPVTKKIRTESPVPRSQTGTPPSEQGITEDVVRRYLLRKPMQTKDLLYKLNPKKVGLTKDEVVRRLTEVLKRLNPDKIKIKDKTYWTIKSANQKIPSV